MYWVNFITLYPQTQYYMMYKHGLSCQTLSSFLVMRVVFSMRLGGLATRDKADVVVLDCVQLTASSAGFFGSGVPSLMLVFTFLDCEMRYQLHVPSSIMNAL